MRVQNTLHYTCADIEKATEEANKHLYSPWMQQH